MKTLGASERPNGRQRNLNVVPSNWKQRYFLDSWCILGILEVEFHHIIALAEEGASRMEALHLELLLGEKSVECLQVDHRAELPCPRSFLHQEEC